MESIITMLVKKDSDEVNKIIIAIKREAKREAGSKPVFLLFSILDPHLLNSL